MPHTFLTCTFEGLMHAHTCVLGLNTHAYVYVFNLCVLEGLMFNT